MPFNGSGTYVPPGLPVFPPSPGQVISSNYYTQLINDIASALSLTFLRDGSVSFTGDFNIGNNSLKNLADGSAASPSVRFNTETNTGIYLNGAGKLCLSVAGTKVAEFTTTALTVPESLNVLTPNSGTTGGLRVFGNATSGNAIIQFTDSAGTTQWGYMQITSAGLLSFADSGGTLRAAGFMDMPLTAGTAGRAITLTDRGMAIPATGNMTIPTNASVAFPVGCTVGVYNNSGSSITIAAVTPGTTTLRLGGSATTGTRTLAQRGLVVLWKVATDEWVALNGGIS